MPYCGMAFFKLNNMEPCEEPFITCDNKELGTEQLLRLLLAKVGDDLPAIRACLVNGSAVGGPRVAHFVATAGQTTFTLPENIRLEVAWFRNGAIKHSAPDSAVVGQKDVVIPAQPVGTEISFIY